MQADTTLAPDDPRAGRLRRDLGRIHRVMGSATLVQRAMPRNWKGVEVTVLDRHDVVVPSTRKAFASLGWQTRIESIDALDWARATHPGGYDLCLPVLFLHRLDQATRSLLLPAIARHTITFVACDPRRSALARLGSQFVTVLGSSDTMRDDAVTGVAAGFTGRELSGAWPPAPGAWALDKYPAGLFMHCFSAVRFAARTMDRHGAPG